ncbi:MAG: HNH endonuclease [Nanoarchaeota archaeon]|nr:HNH endonuclease [Nanoarchaeota archaeon]
MEFQFQRHRIDKISKDKIISELEKVAKKNNFIVFGKREFNEYSEISAGTVIRKFGTWRKAISFLKDYLKNKGHELSARKTPPNRIYSDKELFDEMERIWKQLGHRPSKIEWTASKPKISFGCYKHRFGGWTNTCLKFIEYKMGHEVIIDDIPKKESVKEIQPELKIKKEDKRDIPLKLRLSVLNRDNFRCVFCGRSPATSVGVILHIDHIHPFAKGGKTTLNNLQTLCSKCNIGKSDRKLN